MFGLMVQNGTEWNETKWNGAGWSKFAIPLFGKLKEWNKL
jgi:hypothetical protein